MNRRSNHQRWENLLPYYVNRTLPPPERTVFERHLATCPACQQALEDWHGVAGVVYREVSIWAQQTPPLSSEVRAQVQHRQTAFTSAPAPNASHPLRNPRQTPRSPRRRIQVPLTLVAAAGVIVVFGVLLIYMATRGDNSSPASEAETNNVLQPTDTPLATYTPWSAPTLAQPDDLGILGSDAPTATPFDLQALQPSGVGGAIGAGGAGGASSNFCEAIPKTNSAVAIYDQPGGGAIVAYMTPGEWMDVFQRTIEGWYQLIWPTGYLAGWVRGSEIALNGPCDTLLYPTPTGTAAAPPATPTAAFRGSIGMGYLLVTTEQVGTIPANTRVRISHASLDHMGWWYFIVAEDETTTAEARSWQLTYAPNVTPGPTPTAMYMPPGGATIDLIMREMVGNIPAQSRVNISTGHFNGYDWVYTVVDEHGATSEVMQSQLAPLPPTPIPNPNNASPTFTPTPTSFDTLPPPAQIRTFTADPNPAEAGATITLEWEVVNAAAVSIREIKQSGVFGQWYTDLALSGTLDIVAPENGDSQITVVLVVIDGLGREITGQITVNIE